MIKTFENFTNDFFTSKMYYIDLLKSQYNNYNIIMYAKQIITKFSNAGVNYKIYLYNSSVE
jgi:hypothetical protein